MTPAPRPGPAAAPTAWGTALLAVPVVLAGWVWAAGQVAGRLATGRWPGVPAALAPAIAARALAHAPELRAAWPAGVRHALPASAVIAACGAGLGMLGAAAAVCAAGLTRGLRSIGAGAAHPSHPSRPAVAARGPAVATGAWLPPRRGADPGARWARPRDLGPLLVRRGGGGRLVLGRIGRRLVATEARHSVLVLGPTQSGKTTGLAVPAIVEWDGPVVATSVKDDLVAATASWRAAGGPTWVFDPTSAVAPPAQGADPAPGRAGWSPLAASEDWAGAQRTASWLVEAAPARAGMGDGAFWFAAAAKLLAPLLLAAARAGATMADVVRWNDTGVYGEPLDALLGAGQVEATVALEACAGRDERLRSSVATTLETVLGPFADPVVAAATATTDVDVGALVAGRGTLYLCGPSHEQHRVQGLFAALVATVVAAAVERAHSTGRPLDPPLLVVLDEAANIAPLRDLDTLASTAAGLGIQLVTVCQDLAQLASRYGADRSRTIANNHRAKLLLPGVADLGTLDVISGLAGEAAVRETSESADLRDGRRTRSTTTTYRRLAPTDALRRTPPGRAVLVYGHLPAARLRLRPWYADAGLRRRVGAPGAGGGRRGHPG